MTLLPILQKPKFMEPCNRCGACCLASLCDIAMTVLRPGERSLDGTQAEGADAGPCPALEWDGAQFACGMLRRPDHYMELSWPEEDRPHAREYLRPHFEAYLGLGKGCTMPDEIEGRDD